MSSMDPMDQMNTSNQRGADMDPQVQSALNPEASGLKAKGRNVAACPVCGTLVDKRTATDTLASPVNERQGTVYFDTARCKAIFEEDPQRYGSNF